MQADLRADDSHPAWLRATLAFDDGDFVPLFVGNSRIGWLRPAFAARLAAWPDVFVAGPGRIVLAPGMADTATRSAALARVLEALRAEGLFPGWREELYVLRNPDSGETVLHFERAAAKCFGFTGPASHLNGLVRRADGLHMWIATRSAAKAVSPGKLDNVVAGGIPAGMDAAATLIKECFEEAGMPPELAGMAVRKGEVAFVRAVPEGVDTQHIAVFDIELPGGFAPCNQDGEVAGFELLPVREVLRRLDEPHAFTVDAALVAWDCLRRHGVVS